MQKKQIQKNHSKYSNLHINQIQKNQPQLDQPQPNQFQLDQLQLDQPQSNQFQLNQLQLDQPQPNQFQLGQLQHDQRQQNQLKQPQQQYRSGKHQCLLFFKKYLPLILFSLLGIVVFFCIFCLYQLEPEAFLYAAGLYLTTLLCYLLYCFFREQ